MCVRVILGTGLLAATALADNARTVIEGLIKAKPSTVKGVYLKKCVVSSTMGAGVPVDVKEFITV